MVNSVGYSNVSFGHNPQATTNARPYMSAPYQNAGIPTDTVEIGTAKKKGGKKALGILATVALAGAALYGLFKTGKLKSIENPTKITEKLQNIAYKGGEGIDKGVKFCTEKGKSLIEWVKGKFAKKAVETATDAAAPQA